jgi:hypothetical protein
MSEARVVWEEIMKRFDKVEMVGEPTRVRSNFVKGYSRLPVRIARMSLESLPSGALVADVARFVHRDGALVPATTTLGPSNV